MTRTRAIALSLALTAALAVAGCSTATYSADHVEAAVASSEGWQGEWYRTTAGDEVAAFADWGAPLYFEPDSCRNLYLVSTLVVPADEGSNDTLLGVITQVEWPSTEPQFGAVRVLGSTEAAAGFLDSAEEAALPCADGYVEGEDLSWVVESVDISRVELGDLGEALVIDERNVASTDDDLNPVVGDYTSVLVAHENLVLLAQYFDASDPIATGAAESDLSDMVGAL